VDSKIHWDAVYRAHGPSQLSWFQAVPRVSLDLIAQAVPDHSAEILDVGGGTSTLVDGLVAAGYRRVTVLDLSATALHQARERLGPTSATVTWREADVLSVELPRRNFDLWHDRAVFHFLTRPVDRQRYVAQVRHAMRPGGHVLVATFAEHGPTKCSGLEVSRYSPESLHGEFGAGFNLVSSVREEHLTPWGSHQAFVYCLCRFEPHGRRRVAA
jgi:SAM-dependent methyltransferase